MVYETDFYTTRRPYSRPTISSYSVTNLSTTAVNTRAPEVASGGGSGSVGERSHSQPSSNLSSQIQEAPIVPSTIQPLTAVPPYYHHHGIPFVAHARITPTAPPPRSIRVRPSVLVAEIDRIAHRSRPHLSYQPTEDYLNSMTGFDDETRAIRAHTNALLKRVHEPLPPRSRKPFSFTPSYDVDPPTRITSDAYIQRMLGHNRSVQNEVEAISYYPEPAKQYIGKGHLACLSFAGGRPISKRRNLAWRRDEDRHIKDEVNFLSHYGRMRNAAMGPNMPDGYTNEAPGGLYYLSHSLNRYSARNAGNNLTAEYVPTKSVVDDRHFSSKVVRAEMKEEREKAKLRGPKTEIKEGGRRNREEEEEKRRLEEEEERARKMEERRKDAERKELERLKEEEERQKKEAEEAEKKRKEEEEKIKKEEEERKKKEAEERKKKEAEERKRKEEEEERKRLEEEEMKRKEEEERKRIEEEERKKKEEEEEKKRIEEEERKRVEEEERKKKEEEEERKRIEEEEEKKRQEEEERKRVEEEEQKRLEEEKMKAEEAGGEAVETGSEEKVEEAEKVEEEKVEEPEKVEETEKVEEPENVEEPEKVEEAEKVEDTPEPLVEEPTSPEPINTVEEGGTTFEEVPATPEEETAPKVEEVTPEFSAEDAEE